MRPRCSTGSCAALAVFALTAVGTADAAGRLSYRGLVLPARQVSLLAEPALATPGDSTRLERLLSEVVLRLENQGYLDARAAAAWDTARRELDLEVEEGPRYRLAEVSLYAPARADSERLMRALPLVLGAWASPGAVTGAIDEALRAVVDHGYPYAALGVRGWQVDSGGVRLALTGGLGPLVTITRVRVEGLKTTQPRLAERSMGRLAGRAYDRAAAAAAADRLAALGLFRSVSYEGLEGESDWSRGELVYRVEEPRYNRFEGAFGVQGQAGTVGLARLDLDNLLGTGRAVGLDWESRGRGVVRLGARYAEPLVLGTPLRVEATFDQQVQDTLFVRTRWGARGRFALSDQDHVEASYQEERVVEERVVVAEASLQTTGITLERSTLDSRLAPRRGSQIRFGAAESFKRERLRPSGTRSARASAVELRGAWHHALGPASGLALELQGVARFSSERILPLFERYVLGGASSLRGYDEEEFRVDRFLLTRLEWRWFLGGGGQRVFLFWDHAHAGTRVAIEDGGDRMELLDRDGLGFGLTLSAAGGLVGLDYGLKPGRPPLEGKIHLRLVSTF